MEKVNGNQLIINKANQTKQEEEERQLVVGIIQRLEQNSNFRVWVEALSDYLFDIIKETRQKLNRQTNTASLKYKGVIEAISKKIKETTNAYVNNPILVVKIINHFLAKHNMHIHGLPGRAGIFFVSILQEKISNAELEIERRYREKLSK